MRISKLAIIAGIALALPATARWRAEYALQSDAVQQWYRDAEITPEASRRLFPDSGPHMKCCDHADVVKTHFEVDHTSGGDVWSYEDKPGHMKRIPDDIIHWGESAPNGMPTLFVWQGRETCFFPGRDGI